MISQKTTTKKLAWLIVAMLFVALTACGTPDDTKSSVTAVSEASTTSSVASTTSSVSKLAPSIVLGEISEPPDDPTLMLLAEDANLSQGKKVILEPDDPPYNLGGWQGEGTAIWQKIEIPVDGIYDIGIYYSREYTDEDIWGTITIHSEDTSDREQLKFRVPPTSTDTGDWSVYSYMEPMFITLEAGTYQVELYPGAADHPLPKNEYFLNLRCIIFMLDEDSSTSLEEEKGEKIEYTLEDFAGWWYEIPESDLNFWDVCYVDAEQGTYFTTDKYGNIGEEEILRAYSEKGKLNLAAGRYSASDGYELYFGDDADRDTLYYRSFRDDKEYPAFTRGEAPEKPHVSLVGLPGKWYKNGITTGDAVEIIEFSDDETYRSINSAGKVTDSGSYALALHAGEFYRGDAYDYISLVLNGENTFISDDKRLIAIAYYYEDRYYATGNPMYAGSHIYLHEEEIGSQEAHDAVQRFKLHDGSWSNKEEGSLRFSRDGQVHYYGRNERGWFPEKSGIWEYSDDVLTIIWNADFVDYELQARDSVEKEACDVVSVEDGFTLPSLGRINMEKDD